jgi:hypothetical protein
MEVRMTVVKALAFGALVVGAVVPSATAGPITGGQLQWSSWNAGSGSTFSNAGAANLGGGAGPVASAPSFATNFAPVTTQAAMSTMSLASAPTPAPAPAPAASSSSSGTYDAFINLGTGPYPNSGLLTTGGAQPWYDSSAVASLYGGQPNAQQQAAFSSTVLQRVEQTFQLSGVPVNLTTNPNAPAAHTLSVVSNTTSTWGPVLGLTDIGSNGFDFIDQAAKSAQNVDQLEWLVAHNVAHELMLAFGVPENFDKSGNFIDSPVANTSMMLNPNATFSQAAAAALLAANFQNNDGTIPSQGAQVIGPQPVPEPATLALWALAGLAVVARKARSRVASA